MNVSSEDLAAARSTRAFDLIYLNGDHNLENLKAPDDARKVRLIKEDFFRLMFETKRV